MGDRAGVAEDMGEGMQCSDHPYRNNPGGICAFCLQEKLGKLVSSSKSSTFFPIAPTVASSAATAPAPPLPPSSSSSSPSDAAAAAAIFSNIHKNIISSNNNIANNKKKNNRVLSSSTLSDANLILKRSRSVAVPRHLDSSSSSSDNSPRKKSFWSFLHLSRRTKHQLPSSSCLSSSSTSAERKEHNMISSYKGVETKKDFSSTGAGDENDESPNSSSHASSAASSSFGRKVARSRSVGCGSRSFSGDLLERISTGLGDCALRRVESQREAKPKVGIHRRVAAATDNERIIKERVKCGGIFGGFGMMITSSSSSSSYWLSEDFNGTANAGSRIAGVAPPNGRNRSWGWAFASPMRVFTRPSSSSSSNNAKSYISAVTAEQATGDDGRRSNNAAAGTSSTSNNNPTRANHRLGASPSLLAVRG